MPTLSETPVLSETPTLPTNPEDAASPTTRTRPVQLEARKPVVVVAGGGYSGVLAANRLSGRLAGAARVLLITPGAALTDRIRLHEVAARGGDVRRSYASLLASAVEHLPGKVVGFDPVACTIRVEREGQHESQPYDALILAFGSQFSAHVANTSPHAGALWDVESAQRMAAALRELEHGAPVVVVGGGLSAIELSAELAEAHPQLQVELVARDFAAGLQGPARDALRSGLSALGVSVREGQGVTSMTPDAVLLDDGSRLATRVSALAAGMSGAPLGPGFPLTTRPDGRIAVDEYLRVPELSNVFVAGDLAAPPTAAVGGGLASTRMACATALPLGAHAADQVVRQLRGKPLVPYRFSYALQCISLGRHNGLVVFVDADDQPSGRLVRGRRAALVKEAICRYVMGALRLEGWLAGLYTWPRSGRQRRALRPTQLSA